MKKFFSLIFIMMLLICMTTMVYAATPDTTITSTLDRANALKELGLFAGTDKGLDLESVPNRTQAIIFLLRMLGEEKAAQNSSYTCPFKDVPTWAEKYVSYAYAKGYTAGTSKTTFGTNDNVTPEQFITFMLRALGYSDKSGDFTLPTAIQKAETLGIIQVGKYQTGSKEFTRGDCVDIIFSFLSANKKGENITIIDSLIASGAINSSIAAKYGFGESLRTSVQNLYDLGLFNESDFSGTNIFKLKRAPTKLELAIMYTKILGREEEASLINDARSEHPYTDVPEWAKKYVAYTYWNQLIEGKTDTTFGSSEPITIEQFLACVLKALEYDSTDFYQAGTISKAEEIGLIPVGKYTSNSNFECADCADIIYNALRLNKKLEGVTLIQSLVYDGAISDTAAAKCSLISSPFQRITVPLRKENTGNILYAKDVIQSIPDAKFMSFCSYGFSTKVPFSYYRAFDYKEYNKLLKTASDVSVYKFFTESYDDINLYVGTNVPYSFIVSTVFDKSYNIIATAIFDAKSAIAAGQIEFVLINIDTSKYLNYITTLANRILDNAKELPNDIFYFERYKEEITLIDKKTNKQIGDTFLNNNGQYLYKIIINKEKYPEIASKITLYNDIYLGNESVTGSGDFKDYFNEEILTAMSNRFSNGKYILSNPIEFRVKSWADLDFMWDIKRAFVFGNENDIVGWVVFIPKQVKIVDIGILQTTIYQ